MEEEITKKVMQCPKCRSTNIGFREKGRKYVHFCHDCGFVENQDLKIAEVELTIKKEHKHFSWLNATPDEILDRFPITVVGWGLIIVSLFLMAVLNSHSYILLSMFCAGAIVVIYFNIDFKRFEK